MPGQSGPEFKAQVESGDNRALTPQDLKDQETINNFLKTPKGKEAVTKAQNNSQNELVELSNAAKLNKAENVTNAIINLVNANRKINISNERMKDVTSIGEYVNKLSSKD